MSGPTFASCRKNSRRGVRALFLDHAAASFGCSRPEPAVRDGAKTHRGEPTVRPETSELAYFVSVGLVAVLIIAGCFGIGFSLLAQNTQQIVGGSGTRDRGTEVVVPIRAELPPSAAAAPLPVAPLAQGPAAREAPMPENSDPAGEAPVSAATGALLSRTAPALTSTAREATLTPPATVSPVELKSSFPGATTPATPPARARPAAAKVAELLARGDSFIVVGDIASARVFYERAADAGDRRAALRMGATFDPTFLSRAHCAATSATRLRRAPGTVAPLISAAPEPSAAKWRNDTR
jgi:hypothetical protein